jgi:hypothetical protein
MPRNGSGTHTIPNAFSPTTVIASSQVNANFTDIATEITNSLARDGQSAMNGALQFLPGTAGAPGLAPVGDADSGLYMIGANNLGMAAGGVKRLDIAATGLNVIGNISDDGEDALMAVATKGVFWQTAAPLFWTKSAALNDAALRVVSGTVGGGGTAGFTSAFAARAVAQANLPNVTLNLSQTVMTDVSNSGGTQGSASGAGGGPTFALPVVLGKTLTAVTASLGGSGTAMDFAVKYQDVILATKDARL